MNKEIGTVVRVEKDAVWVETQQKTSCQSCASEKGCGQGLLSRMMGKTMTVRALMGSDLSEKIKPNDRVVIGLPDGVITSATLLLYMIPLMTLITGVMVAHSWSGSDGMTALGGLIGLILGGLLVRFNSFCHRHDKRLQPVVLERLSTAN